MLVVIPSLLSRLLIVHRLGADRDEIRRLLPILVALPVGIWLGTQLLASLSTPALSAIIGLLAMLFAVLILLELPRTLSSLSARPSSRRVPAAELGKGVSADQGATAAQSRRSSNLVR